MADLLLRWSGMGGETSERPFPHGAITGKILASFFDVHRELGCGFSEIVYRRALAIVLRASGLTANEEVLLTVLFRGATIGTFRADMVVADVVLVEIKAATSIEAYAQAQVLNYLKAAGGGVGMLLNFGRQAAYERLVIGDPTNSLPVLKTRSV